jgi:dihydroorotase
MKMNPPLRAEADRLAVIEGLRDGTIDCIATDHAPHTVDDKKVEFDRAAFGVVGLETAVSLCLDRLVRPGLLTLAQLVNLLSTGPARVLSLPGGTLAPGAPADLTLLDLDRRVKVDPARFVSKGRNTPFAGWTLRGAPAVTIVGGRVAWKATP